MTTPAARVQRSSPSTSRPHHPLNGTPVPRAAVSLRPARSSVSFSPHSLSPSFDVVAELTTNRDAYQGDEWFTLCTFPQFLRTSLDRIRRQVPPPKPSLSLAVAACIANGVRVIGQHEDLRALGETKARLDVLKDVDAAYVDEVSVYFRTFPLGISDPAQTGVRRQNVKLPEDVHGDVLTVCDEVGLSASALCTLAVMVTLSSQDVILKGHTRQLNDIVETFWRRAKLRRAMAEALVETLEEEARA